MIDRPPLQLPFRFPAATRWLALVFTTCISLSASPTSAAPSVEEVDQFQHREGKAAAMWLLKHGGGDPEAVFAALRERSKNAPNYSLMQDGMRLCRDVARYARRENDVTALQAAATVADALLRKNATPSGAFIEWDRNTWLDESTMWRTIPWGVAFCGNRAFEAWREVKDAFTPAQRRYWQAALERTGRWITRTPWSAATSSTRRSPT